MKQKVIITFREVKHGQFKGDIDAVFLESWHDHYSDQVVCYAHIGQHGSGDYTYFKNNTKPAKNYDSLLSELKSIYSDCELIIHDKLTRKFLPARQ